MIRRLGVAVLCLAACAGAPALAQTAKQLFAPITRPSTGPAAAIGGNSKGCLAGGDQLPENGPGWQAMRLSRNHHWGTPDLVAFVERLSVDATRIGWKGIYVGDMSQPRGGPVAGHASHQTGLDVDIWLNPPARLDLSRRERERVSAMNVRTRDQRGLNANWTPSHEALLRLAASDPAVDRIFITPPAKLAMCAHAPAGDRAWLRKIRPWWGHNDHFHVRLRCPKAERTCIPTVALPPGDGCAEAVWWVTDALKPPDPNAPKPKPAPPTRMADLPPRCAEVLSSR
ncbi:penicillin-insensitive murein endopeptidase [Amaricoccus solimangrovi]|uniref:Penicillin-insensitive murein endopeptidase n=1 Tax=Amaricoccus solimangrovi TaxID=2589815 RepID=A0A501WTG7_9RHOB|nr:penicillin-insensitive murein endopeptidase [Amaricoccus solimangrovi]TPE50251.1 penicillin-insensitive murein endopeptidase [Amaricoccus solimangrovi]